MTSKIVVIGSVEGYFRELFAKISKIQTKNEFSLAIITGDLFSNQTPGDDEEDVNALLGGSISVPLPTYFTVGRHGLPISVVKRLESGEDVCANLFFLGRGTYKTTESIRFVTLGGTRTEKAPTTTNAGTKYSPSYTESDARGLHGAHNGDILLSADWPLGVQAGSRVSGPVDVQSQEAIAELVVALKPRYHLSSSAEFYEREPFFHPSSEDEPSRKSVTRFISLAPFKNASGQKWLYAFSFDPVPSETLPADATVAPFGASKKRKALTSQDQSYSRFNGHQHHGEEKRQRRRGPPPVRGPEECFLCLSNKRVETHMICAIGDQAYLTIAKGPLPLSSTFPAIGFPMHMLIIPFAHTSKFIDIEDPAATYTEMQQFRHAVYDMIAAKSGSELGAVCWEVSRRGIRHFLWQILPTPADLRKKEGLVEAAFKIKAKDEGYGSFTNVPSQDPIPAERGDYFRVWTWNPPVSGLEDETNDTKLIEKSMILPLAEDLPKFNINFGRTVMSTLLHLERRINWQDAVQTQAEEEDTKENVTQAFKAFDFTT